MEYFERLDTMLNFLYENYKEKGDYTPLLNPSYGLNLNKFEKEKYENDIESNFFIKVVRTKAGLEITITPNGIQFLKDGGYTTKYQHIIREEQEAEKERKQNEEVAAAAIRQAEAAEEANRLSEEANRIAHDARMVAWLAFGASLVALAVSIFS